MGQDELIIIRERECARRTGLSRSTRWRLERAGEFPARVALGARSVGWRSSEINAWIKGRSSPRPPPRDETEAKP